jgi:hypothetical protein
MEHAKKLVGFVLVRPEGARAHQGAVCVREDAGCGEPPYGLNAVNAVDDYERSRCPVSRQDDIPLQEFVAAHENSDIVNTVCIYATMVAPPSPEHEWVNSQTQRAKFAHCEHSPHGHVGVTNDAHNVRVLLILWTMTMGTPMVQEEGNLAPNALKLHSAVFVCCLHLHGKKKRGAV